MSTMRPTRPDHPCPPNSNPENTSQQPAATKTKTQALDGPAPVCALPGKSLYRMCCPNEEYMPLHFLRSPDSVFFPGPAQHESFYPQASAELHCTSPDSLGSPDSLNPNLGRPAPSHYLLHQSAKLQECLAKE